jgi:hypothetical protein
MFNTPGNMVTGPKWNAALYIDDNASSEQADVLIKIYSGQAGGFFAAAANFIGEMLGVKSVPIEFGIDGKRLLNGSSEFFWHPERNIMVTWILYILAPKLCC